MGRHFQAMHGAGDNSSSTRREKEQVWHLGWRLCESCWGIVMMAPLIFCWHWISVLRAPSGVPMLYCNMPQFQPLIRSDDDVAQCNLSMRFVNQISTRNIYNNEHKRLKRMNILETVRDVLGSELENNHHAFISHWVQHGQRQGQLHSEMCCTHRDISIQNRLWMSVDSNPDSQPTYGCNHKG